MHKSESPIPPDAFGDAVLLADGHASAHEQSSRPRLPNTVITRSTGLLPMLYRPAELAREIGVDVKTLKRWAAAGMPHAREADGQMWIEGRQFAAWVRRSIVERRRALAEHEAFCMKCRAVVAPEAWEPARHGKMSLRRGACPACGERVFRGRVGEGRGRG